MLQTLAANGSSPKAMVVDGTGREVAVIIAPEVIAQTALPMPPLLPSLPTPAVKLLAPLTTAEPKMGAA